MALNFSTDVPSKLPVRVLSTPSTSLIVDKDLMFRSSSPIKELEPSSPVCINVLQLLEMNNFKLLHPVYEEAATGKVCQYIKVISEDGVMCYVSLDKHHCHNITMPGMTYMKANSDDCISISTKLGIKSILGKDISGVVFEKANTLVIMSRNGKDFEEKHIIVAEPRESGPHYIIYPLIDYDYIVESNVAANLAIAMTSKTIEESIKIGIDTGIREVMATLEKYYNMIDQYKLDYMRYMEKNSSIIKELESAKKGWEIKLDSTEKREKLGLIIENLSDKRKDAMELIPITRVLVDKKRCIETSIQELDELVRKLSLYHKNVENIRDTK